ncbi:MAG: 50S ribosomal protein L24 [Candidatus Lindowbacteria bacterium RIFCSPLOWO2_12_FULL_62_27]|nr:MAG: 50S ribosomal protein L24 [Candidatus Lindowbacteria bacterium RIFCSPLOWO2_12_FULL_62_27]
MQRLYIRKGDRVAVLSGNERGAVGKVLSVDRNKYRAVVEGVALRKKHVRRTQQNPKGGVIEKEAALHVSNLMVICPKCNKPSRLARRVVDGRSLRVCKKCDETLA